MLCYVLCDVMFYVVMLRCGMLCCVMSSYIYFKIFVF